MSRITLILALGTAGVACADEWSKRFTVNGPAELRVNANDGAVSIKTWDRKEIEARVTTNHWKIPSDLQIVEHQVGDRVEIELRMPRHALSFNIGNRGVRLELQVPRDLKSDIRTDDGSITIDGVRGDTRLHTGDGRIEATAVDGSLDAQTGDGRIRVRGRFDLMNLRTGDGSIEAEVSAGSRMTSAWSLHTGDGHVVLRLPQEFSAELNVHTGDGHIRSDLPVTASGMRHDHELRGRLNAGGPMLTVRTNDGSITLERL